jgi:hypothetical protein
LLDKDASRSRILAALMAPGRTEGVRKIAKRLGVDPGHGAADQPPFRCKRRVRRSRGRS